VSFSGQSVPVSDDEATEEQARKLTVKVSGDPAAFSRSFALTQEQMAKALEPMVRMMSVERPFLEAVSRQLAEAAAASAATDRLRMGFVDAIAGAAVFQVKAQMAQQIADAMAPLRAQLQTTILAPEMVERIRALEVQVREQEASASDVVASMDVVAAMIVGAVVMLAYRVTMAMPVEERLEYWLQLLGLPLVVWAVGQLRRIP
jgi:tRNA(Glu) U13 pseudouridine synthase TruD